MRNVWTFRESAGGVEGAIQLAVGQRSRRERRHSEDQFSRITMGSLEVLEHIMGKMNETIKSE